MPTDPRYHDFLEEIQRESQQTRAKLEQQRQDALAAETKRAQRVIVREMRALTERRKAAVRRETGHALAETRHALRRALCDKREALCDDLFAEAEARVAAFVKSEAYPAYWQKALARAAEVAPLAGATLSCRDADVALANAVEGVTVVTDESIRLGGFRLRSADGRLAVDETLDARLDAQRAAFRDRSGLTVVSANPIPNEGR